ncbi:hypothetical protein H4219_006094 [Mycoemilia scoparia]|uniref:Uncharacterized protein n=1 Tax=Mycoemilia scoparia TaxID=417184 RepID=A0A9W8DNL8_9FUNG|nr:hypothetical protein H4219_006094 [Mycoemilia scoparia]
MLEDVFYTTASGNQINGNEVILELESFFGNIPGDSVFFRREWIFKSQALGQLKSDVGTFKSLYEMMVYEDAVGNSVHKTIKYDFAYTKEVKVNP